ncbi:MAG: sugar ABC transporter permease [Clostridiales bacterium]|jgi:multiple sugar transport system permease protein|nr:sugar ABC transporter permease [Clostridiales bacterium]
MRKKTKGVSYSKYGYIFSIPFVVAFCLFTMYPLFNTAFMSFTDYAGVAARESGEMNILGDPLELYKNLFENQLFVTSMKNTIKIWSINFVPQIVLALVLAAWFTSRRNKFKGQGLFKILFYMPNIITAGSIAFLFSTLFNFYGPMNYLLTDILGFLDAPFRFHESATASQLVVAFIQFWMWYGYTMLILIAGIMGLNPEMYECSEIDGANGLHQFFYVTLPNLKTIILYVLVTSIVGGLTMFDIPRLYNNGNPVNATHTLSMFIYNQAFGGRFFLNRAAAASMIVFVMVAILSIAVFFLLRDKDAVKERREIRASKRAQKLVQKGVY